MPAKCQLHRRGSQIEPVPLNNGLWDTMPPRWGRKGKHSLLSYTRCFTRCPIPALVFLRGRTTAIRKMTHRFSLRDTYRDFKNSLILIYQQLPRTYVTRLKWKLRRMLRAFADRDHPRFPELEWSAVLLKHFVCSNCSTAIKLLFRNNSFSEKSGVDFFSTKIVVYYNLSISDVIRHLCKSWKLRIKIKADFV